VPQAKLASSPAVTRKNCDSSSSFAAPARGQDGHCSGNVKVSNIIREEIAIKDVHLSIPTRLSMNVTSRKQGNKTCVELDHQRCNNSASVWSNLRDPVSDLQPRYVILNIGREPALTQDLVAEWSIHWIDYPVFRAFSRISLCSELPGSFFLLIEVLPILCKTSQRVDQ
jgi:hypothetical protein